MRKLLKEDGPELAVLLEFLDARRLCLRRSSSVVPPQIPAAPMCDAHRRHGPHTGQVRHICLASSIWSKEAPVVPIGQKSSGSTSRHAAYLLQSVPSTPRPIRSTPWLVSVIGPRPLFLSADTRDAGYS